MNDISEQDIRCPISGLIFLNPIKCDDGFVYEEASFLRWFMKKGTSPITRKRIVDMKYTVDDETKDKVQKFLENNKELVEDIYILDTIDKFLLGDPAAFEIHDFEELLKQVNYHIWIGYVQLNFFKHLIEFDFLSWTFYLEIIRNFIERKEYKVLEVVENYKWNLSWVFSKNTSINNLICESNNPICKTCVIVYDLTKKINIILDYRKLLTDNDHLQFLLENGMSPDIIVSNYSINIQTLLRMTIINKNNDAFQLLIKHGANYSFVDPKEQCNQFHIVARNGTYEMFKTLYDLKLPLHEKTSYKWNVLQFVLFYQDKDTLKKIIDGYGKELGYTKEIIFERFYTNSAVEYDKNLDLTEVMKRRITVSNDKEEDVDEISEYLKNKIS